MSFAIVIPTAQYWCRHSPAAGLTVPIPMPAMIPAAFPSSMKAKFLRGLRRWRVVVVEGQALSLALLGKRADHFR